PSVRTAAGYRQYGEKELLRLQQILFYKELDFPLQAIAEILDEPDFDYLAALENHKTALAERRTRITELLTTIDKTILQLKGEQKMLTNEELYAGFPKEKGEAYRKEAIEKYGREKVEKSEAGLRKLTKEQLEVLKAEGEEVANALMALMHLEPSDERVQAQVARHYAHIQKMWNGAVTNEHLADAYAGLGDLYVNDSRFYEGAPEGFNKFLCSAMKYYVENSLR
ncbi:MAG TPA: MerR family transcriptional regulator, partial [Bacteroidia bacterium]|nr:MerR family transcriptional regulator [Bacteroidia bacterium]